MAATIQLDVLSSTQLGVFVHFDIGDSTTELTCFANNIYCRLLRQGFINFLCEGLPGSEQNNLAKDMIGIYQGVLIPSSSISRRVPDANGVRPASPTTYAPADVGSDTITIDFVENPAAPVASNATIASVCNNPAFYAIRITYSLPAPAVAAVDKYFILTYPDVAGLFSFIP